MTPSEQEREAREAVLACGGINWREDTNAALDVLTRAIEARVLAEAEAFALDRLAVRRAVVAEAVAKVEGLEKSMLYEPHEEERVWGFNEGIEAAATALRGLSPEGGV